MPGLGWRWFRGGGVWLDCAVTLAAGKFHCYRRQGFAYFVSTGKALVCASGELASFERDRPEMKLLIRYLTEAMH